MRYNEMATCSKVPITELLSFIVDNRGKSVPTSDSGYVLIATNCIKNDSLYPVFEKIRYLNDETYKTWFRAHPLPGDIIFVNKGTPGRVCMVPNPVNFCIAQDMMAFRVNEKVYNKYLFAVLRSSEMQKTIENGHVGTLIPHFKKSHLHQLLVPLPSMETQISIGDFYFVLSKKIELNNQITANLEAQAQAIFKSWFVDFEPFQNGEFVDSELGMIPKGWGVSSLGDIARYVAERIPTKHCNTENYISTENMMSNKKGVALANSLPSTPAVSRYAENDILISNIRPYFKKIWLADKIGGCSNDILVIRAKHESLGELLYSILYSDSFFDYATATSKGTKMPRGDKLAIMKYPIALPQSLENDGYILQLTTIALYFQKKISELHKENKNLAALRDTLLPKLMSGEIEVPVADIMIHEGS